MKQIRECTHIFRPLKGRTLLVFTMGKNSSGLTTLLDEPVQLNPEQFGLEIEKVLSEALDSYAASAPPARVWRAPDGNAGGFIKKHLCVSVERFESGDLKVQPLHHHRGGYIGREGEHTIIPKAEVPTKIASLLADAFAIAT